MFDPDLTQLMTDHPPQSKRRTRPEIEADNDLLRSRVEFWRGAFVLAVGVAVAVCLAFAQQALGSDPLNEDLQTAAADALAIHNQTDGTAVVRYLSVYALPPEERNRAARAVSVACHLLSHAGIPVQPSRPTETLIRLDILNDYDPFNKAWIAAWEQVIPADRRWHVDAKTAVVAGGFEAYLRLPNNSVGWFPVDVVERGETIVVLHNNIRYRITDTKNFRQRGEKVIAPVKAKTVYGAWVDIDAAQQLADLTGSEGALLEARDFVYLTMYTPLYYEFRKTPQTLQEWRTVWGEKAPNGFGQLAVYGANLDTSNVTFAPRGLQRWPRGIWETFDTDKGKEFTDDKNPFVRPDRTAVIDATEAFALMANGGIDCFIADGKGNRVDAVPAGVAIDTSYGPPRELRPPLSCISCHCKIVSDGELSYETCGFLDFIDQQTSKTFAAKDRFTAAKMDGYYFNQPKLQARMRSDRADFLYGISIATADPEPVPPSVAANDLNWMVHQVFGAQVSPRRACWELGIEPGDDPVTTLHEWLGESNRDGLVDLLNGDSVHFLRFRNAMPAALELIHAKRNESVVELSELEDE